MYTVRMRTKVVREEADKYLYDTFVCYSQTDRQWVFEHLVAKLEDGGRWAGLPLSVGDDKHADDYCHFHYCCYALSSSLF